MGDRLTNGDGKGLVTVLMAVLLLGLSLTFCSHVGAQEGHPWILKPEYRTATGAHCCGPVDHCKVAQAGELTPIPNGWRHNPTGTEIHSDKPGIYPTEDRAGRMFRCVIGQSLVCVFEGMGT